MKGRNITIVGGAVLMVALFLSPLSFGQSGTTEKKGFRDCSNCPEMIPIPGGTFTMGSPSGELYRGAEAQHRVSVRPFAIGKYEVTFAEWNACVQDGGCNGYHPEDEGWGQANLPVINVSWNDAKAYIDWLSRKTGKPYRLPSEAEWEYAARAGSTAPFSFGQTITTNEANYDGSTGYGSGPAGVNRQRTLPVGSFPANRFGLHDMHGNVWEWVEDCWHEEYTADAPADGAPWTTGECGGRVLRGGSWEDYPGDVRSAARVGGGVDEQSYGDGFRVALQLN